MAGGDSNDISSVPGGARSVLYDRETNSEAAISPSGALETAELIRLIGGNFESGTLPAITWATNVTGSGTAIAAIGELMIRTGTIADSTAEVQTVNRAEFTTATLNKAHLAFQMDNFTNADVIREFGMFDPVTPIFSGDGVFFRNNSGAFSVVRRKGGAEVEEVTSANFSNVADNPFVADDLLHVYEIVYNAGSALFFRDRKLLHRMVEISEVAYETTHLTLGARCENINGNIVDNTLETRGFSCSRIGTSTAEPDSITISAASSGLLKNSPGKLVSIILNDTGVGGATLDLYDNVAIAGGPVVSLDLTDSITDLDYGRRLNTGLFFDASGAGFQLIINWR